MIEHLEPYAGRIAVTGLGRASLGPVDRFLGVATSVVGDHERAAAYLRDAIDLCVDSGALAHEARAHHDLARVLCATGRDADLREAARANDRAEEIATRIGLVLDQVDLPGLSQVAGVAAPGPADPA